MHMYIFACLSLGLTMCVWTLVEITLSFLLTLSISWSPTPQPSLHTSPHVCSIFRHLKSLQHTLPQTITPHLGKGKGNGSLLVSYSAIHYTELFSLALSISEMLIAGHLGKLAKVLLIQLAGLACVLLCVHFMNLCFARLCEWPAE